VSLKAHKRSGRHVAGPSRARSGGPRIRALDRLLAAAFKQPLLNLKAHVEPGSMYQLGSDTMVFRVSAKSVTTFFGDQSVLGHGESRTFTTNLPKGLVKVRLFEGWPHAGKPHYELEVTVVTPDKKG
jgi:hypothetical protein